MRILLVATLLGIAFAGCIGDEPAVDSVDELPPVVLTGQVLTPNFNAIPGVEISFEAPVASYVDGSASNDTTIHQAVSDANGNFSLEAPPGTYVVAFHHDDFQDKESQLTFPGDITVTLQPALVDVPYNDAFDFDGTIQCAAEYLIITPSCDTLLGYPHERDDSAPDVSVFDDNSIFDITTPSGWQTIVLDITYDGSEHPGIAGLRTSAYATDAEAEVFSYQRITQKWAPTSYTLRIDAGSDYGDAVPAPDSDGGDGIRFEFYPQGHADDTVCVPADSGLPEEGRCFLGIGIAQDVSFTATATIFVHEAAPPGWTSFARA